MNAVLKAASVLCLLAMTFVGEPARADVWACKDKEGVVRFADRKLRGYRCVLYAKTPAAPKPLADAASAPPSSDGGPTAFSRPKDLNRIAPIPYGPSGAADAAGGSAPRFTGDEPEEQAARERLYAPYIEEAARLYDIPEDFIRAVIRVESNYRYRATSSAGARGLMQLMPSVIKDMGVGDVWDPRANVLGGTRLIRVLADRFEGDIVKVLAAYHAGGGAVSAAEGIPYEATESYVRAVLDRYYEYRSRAN